MHICLENTWHTVCKPEKINQEKSLSAKTTKTNDIFKNGKLDRKKSFFLSLFVIKPLFLEI